MRILIVEDEKRLAAGLRNGLEAEGFAVDVAATGTDGLWLAREHPYDAIVLDILLPGVNGYAICQTLRAESVWTPILMLTAKDGEWDQVEALDTGADDAHTNAARYRSHTETAIGGPRPRQLRSAPTTTPWRSLTSLRPWP